MSVYLLYFVSHSCTSLHLNTDSRHVVPLMDEMKVREDLVFDRNGELIGYVDIGDINNQLRKLEKNCKIQN